METDVTKTRNCEAFVGTILLYASESRAIRCNEERKLR
jgi:hypothetical protein